MRHTPQQTLTRNLPHLASRTAQLPGGGGRKAPASREGPQSISSSFPWIPARSSRYWHQGAWQYHWCVIYCPVWGSSCEVWCHRLLREMFARCDAIFCCARCHCIRWKGPHSTPQHTSLADRHWRERELEGIGARVQETFVGCCGYVINEKKSPKEKETKWRKHCLSPLPCVWVCALHNS